MCGGFSISDLAALVDYLLPVTTHAVPDIVRELGVDELNLLNAIRALVGEDFRVIFIDERWARQLRPTAQHHHVDRKLHAHGLAGSFSRGSRHSIFRAVEDAPLLWPAIRDCGLDVLDKLSLRRPSTDAARVDTVLFDGGFECLGG